MDLIARNPYRILGVFANDSNRVRTANIGKIRAFLKVGKDVHFDIDAQNLLGPLERNQEMIERANALLADENEAAIQALFWFHSNNSDTASVIKEFSSENAIRILTSDEANMGSYVYVLNRAITFLALEDFASATRQYSLFLESPSDIRAFREAISFPLPPNGSTSDKYFVQLFIERLAEGYPDVDWWEYFLKSLTKKMVLTHIKSVFEKLALARINDNINNAQQQKPVKSTEWLRIAQRLRRNCIRHIKVLQPLEGNTLSAECLLMLDKLSSELVREGKLYYQSAKTENEQSAIPTLQLVDYALSIASSSDVKENGATLKKELEKDIKLLPPKEVREEDEDIKSQIKEYCKKTDEIRWSITLVNNCIPHLKSIKEKLGSDNAYYVHISTKIADNALYNSVFEVKQVERQYKVSNTSSNYSKLANTLRRAWELLLYLQKLNLSEEFCKGKLLGNVERVKKSLELYYVEYSDIIVNVNLLTEKETILLCADYETIDSYCKLHPNSCFINEALHKKWELEIKAYPKELTVKNLLEYKAKYPNNHKDVIVQSTLETLILKDELWTIGDYQKYLACFPKGAHRQKALDRINDIVFASYHMVEEFNRYIINNPKGKHYDEALRKIEDLIYESVLKSRNYKEYFQRYPQGLYVGVLKKKEEEQCFGRCEKKKDYKEYIKKYPQGSYSNLAQAIIKKSRNIGVLIVVGVIFLGLTTFLTHTLVTSSSKASNENRINSVSNVTREAINNTNEDVANDQSYRQSNTSTIDISYLKSQLSEESEWGENSLPSGSKPYSSQFGKVYTGENYIFFKTRGECDYVIIVRRSSDGKYMNHVYIRGGDSTTLYLPDGHYYVYFYSGKGWNPNKKKGNVMGGFVSMESQQKDGPIELISAWYEYTLYPVPNGNLQLKQVSEKEMFN